MRNKSQIDRLLDSCCKKECKIIQTIAFSRKVYEKKAIFNYWIKTKNFLKKLGSIF